MALLTTPVLALVDPAFVPVPLLVVNLPLSALVAIRERGAVDRAALPFALAGRVGGTAAGALVVAAVSTRTLQVVVALVVLGAVAVSARGPAVAPGPRTLVAAGFASGVTGTTASLGGPPIALLYRDAPGARLRSTLAVYFLVGSSLSIAGLALAGVVTRHALVLAAVLVPGTLLGFAASSVVAPHVDRRGLRGIVLATSGASAVVLLVTALA
jgi:hypothetical protein